jgi:hypothetical protein
MSTPGGKIGTVPFSTVHRSAPENDAHINPVAREYTKTSPFVASTAPSSSKIDSAATQQKRRLAILPNRQSSAVARVERHEMDTFSAGPGLEAESKEGSDPLEGQMTLLSKETRDAYGNMQRARVEAAEKADDTTATPEAREAANTALVMATHKWVTEAAAELRYLTSGPGRLVSPTLKKMLANMASQALNNLLVFSLSSGIALGLEERLKDNLSNTGALGVTAGVMALMLSLGSDAPQWIRRQLGGAEAELQFAFGNHNTKGIFKKIGGSLSLTTLAVLLHGATSAVITAAEPLSHTLPGGQVGRAIASGLVMAAVTQGVVYGMAKHTEKRQGVTHPKYLPEPHTREDPNFSVVMREDTKLQDRATWGLKGKEVAWRTLSSVAGAAVFFGIASMVDAHEESIRNGTQDPGKINSAQVNTQLATIYGAYTAMFAVISMFQALGTLLLFDAKRHISRAAKPANEVQIRQIKDSAQVATMALIQHVSVAMDRGSLGEDHQERVQDLAEVLSGRTYREAKDGIQPDGQEKIAEAYGYLRTLAKDVIKKANDDKWLLTDGTLMQIAHSLHTAADSLEIAEKNYLRTGGGGKSGVPEGDGDALFPELSSAAHGLRDIRHMLMQCLVQVGGDTDDVVDSRLQKLAMDLLPTLAAVDKADRMNKGLGFNQALTAAAREQDHFDRQGKLQTAVGVLQERTLSGNPGLRTFGKLADMLAGGGIIDAATRIMHDTDQDPAVIDRLLDRLLGLKYGDFRNDTGKLRTMLGDPQAARMLLLLNKLHDGQIEGSDDEAESQAGTALLGEGRDLDHHMARLGELDRLQHAQERADRRRQELQTSIRERQRDLATARADLATAQTAQRNAARRVQGNPDAQHAAEQGQPDPQEGIDAAQADITRLQGLISTAQTEMDGLQRQADKDRNEYRQAAPQFLQDFVSDFRQGKFSMDDLHGELLSKLDGAKASDESAPESAPKPTGGDSAEAKTEEPGDPVNQFRALVPQAFIDVLKGEHVPKIDDAANLGGDLLKKLWSDMEKAPQLRQDAVKAAMSLPVLLHIPGVPMHYQKDIHAHLTNYNGIITNMARQAMENKANRVEAQLNAAIPHQVPNSTGEKKYYTVIDRLMDYVNRDYALAQGWLQMTDSQRMRVLELTMRYSNDPAENIQVTSTGGDPTDKNSQKRELAHLERAFRNTGVPIRIVGETTLDKEKVKELTPRRIRVAAESSVNTITETVNTGKVFLMHADGGASSIRKDSNKASLDQLFRDVKTTMDFPSADSVIGQPGLGHLAKQYALLIHAHGPGLGKTISDRPDHVRYIDEKLTEINKNFGDKGELNIDLSWDFVGHYICENQYDVMKHNNTSPLIQQAMQNVLKSYRAFDSVGAPSDKADDVSQVDQAGEWRVASDAVAGLHFEALSSYQAIVKEEFKDPKVRADFLKMVKERGDGSGNNWLYLLNKHKDRFLYGSDTLAPGIKAHGQSAYALNSRMLEPMYVLFDELKTYYPDEFPDDVASMIARDNFDRVMNEPRMEARREGYSRQTAEGAGVWGSGPIRPNPRAEPAPLAHQKPGTGMPYGGTSSTGTAPKVLTAPQFLDPRPEKPGDRTARHSHQLAQGIDTKRTGEAVTLAASRPFSAPDPTQAGTPLGAPTPMQGVITATPKPTMDPKALAASYAQGDAVDAYMPPAKAWLESQGAVIVPNSGKGLNCLIISLLQHATSAYTDDLQKELKIEQTAAALRKELKLGDDMLYGDDEKFAQLVKRINTLYPDAKLNVTIALPGPDDTFATFNHNPDASTENAVLILQGSNHYEAVTMAPKTA